MDLLIFGDSGTISRSVVSQAFRQGIHVTAVKRTLGGMPDGMEVLCGDARDEEGLRALLAGRRFDAVAHFVAFTPQDVERDLKLLRFHRF